MALRLQTDELGLGPARDAAPGVVHPNRMHGCHGFVVTRLAEKALRVLENELGALWNLGVGRQQVVEGLVGARVVRAEEGQHLAIARLDPHRFMRAQRGFREELGCPSWLVPKELEPAALKGDMVADLREPPMGQIELKARLPVVRCGHLRDRGAIGVDCTRLRGLCVQDRERVPVGAAHRGAPLHQTDRRDGDLRLIRDAHRYVGRCVERCRKRCEQHGREHRCDEFTMSQAPYNIANL